MDARQEHLKVKKDGVEYTIYPYTTTKCVTNSDGENLDVILSRLASSESGGNADLTNYYNKQEVDNLLADKADSDDIPNLSEYAKISDIPNLDEYAKISDIPNLDGYAKTSDIPNTDGFATESYVNSAIANAQLSGGGTDGNVDLSMYYQKSEVDALLKDKADSDDIPNLSGYAKTSDIPNLDGYAKTSDIPDVSSYAKTTDVNQSLAEKVDITQGTNNVNKILQVNSMGKLALANLPEVELTKQDIIDALGYEPSNGGADGNTTYTLTKNGNTITLTGSDGSTTSVEDSDTDTDTVYTDATSAKSGLMSASDKSKLDSLSTTVIVTSDPGVGATVSYADGTIIFVQET